MVRWAVSCVLFVPALVWAEDDTTPHALESPTLHAIHQAEAARTALPYPLIPNRTDGGLTFDVGDSERPRLQLQLTESPVSDGESAAGFAATIGSTAPAGIGFGLGILAEESATPFQTLGSIQCHDGILSPGSYRASDCQFVNEDRTSMLRTDLGARYQAPSGFSSSVSLFNQRNDVDLAGGTGYTRIGGAPMLNAGLLTPVLTNPLLPGPRVAEPLNYVRSEMTGVDLQFALGVATGFDGDLQLGLQLTRVMDAEWDGTGLPGLGTFDWSLADPYDTASLSLDWNVGAFSSGIQSFYREQVDFLNRESLDSYATFDVHFTWRTPWNGSLSLGASNVLDAGQDDGGAESVIADPFESVYGRIPYVRYKQDL